MHLGTQKNDLLGLDGVDPDTLTALLDAAEARVPMAEGVEPAPATLAGRLVANFFFEDSTRTRCSFAAAAQRLGANVVNLAGEGSSMSKGETLADTARNIAAMGVDTIVMRHAASGAALLVARAVDIPVINAGDGRHEHPTQGLLDILTLRRRLGSIRGRTIGIVGDIANSRVARSALFGLTTLGAKVILVGPPTLVGAAFTRIGAGPAMVRVEHDLDAVLPELDAVMMLRIQLERAAGGAIAADYRQLYGLSPDRMERLPAHALVMHPGPLNRGIEIDSAVADHTSRSVILAQVAMGVAVRMAVLEWALRG
ncbi:MAG: aspartate carbamoyltransferase catalytic subunit [Phycisphaerales bacterium]|nr:aspartate carbamoyltransferase catalytic subunit [Phycisphaerales bacterium]